MRGSPSWLPKEGRLAATLNTDVICSPADSSLASGGAGHYDFVEVGTSTWGTLTQYCAGDQREGAALGSRIRSADLGDLRWARGLAVEAVGEHLEVLPSLPRVTKVHAAMDEYDSRQVLYCVSAKNVHEYMGKLIAHLPGASPLDGKVDVMWYALSLSSICHPHPELEYMLRSVGRLDLLEQRDVDVLSWTELCRRHRVSTVDVVQIDCEGKDCAILRGLIAHCVQKPVAFPRIIQFEANHLTGPDEVRQTLDDLARHGYFIRRQTDQNIIVERDML